MRLRGVPSPVSALHWPSHMRRSCFCYGSSRRIVELRLPTGPLPVGRTSVTPGDLRLWIWCAAATAAPTGAYSPDAIRTEWERARPGFINFLTAGSDPTTRVLPAASAKIAARSDICRPRST